MSAFRALIGREFCAFFATPFGWILLAASQFILAFHFIARIALYSVESQSTDPISPTLPGVTERISIALLVWSVPFLFLLIPLATMRAWSDERRHATLPLLLGAPIRRITLCLGKFIATLGFTLIPLVFMAIMTLSLNIGTAQDTGKLLASLLALTLLVTAGTSLGLYFSSLSRHPATAALATAGTLLFLWHIDWSAGTDHPYLGFAPILALPGHLAPFFGGLLSLSGVLYFLIFTGLFLVLSWRQIDYIMQPKPLAYKTSTVLIVISALVLVWGTSQLERQIDITREQSQSLATEARDIVSQLTEPVALQVYVNRDPATRYRLERLVTRFKPHINSLSVEWINPETEPDRAREAGVTQNGEVVIGYADRQSRVTTPTDTNMTYAFYRLLNSTRVWTVYLDGLGGRDPLGSASPDYGYFSQQMESLGIQLQQVDFKTNPVVPDNATTLIVSGYLASDPVALAETLATFVAGGGSVLLLVEPDQAAEAAPTLQKFGLHILPGRLIDLAGQGKFNLPNPAFLAVDRLITHPVSANLQPPILLPVACSLEFTDLLNSSLIPLLSASGIERLFPPKAVASLTSTAHQPAADALLAVASPAAQGSGRVAVLCDSDVFSNAYIGNGSNLPFGLNLIRWLNGEQQSLAIPQLHRPDQSLRLTPLTAALFELIFKFVLPLLLVGCGMVLRLWRRRRA